MFLINDSGDSDYSEYLWDEYPQFTQIHHPTRRGLAGALRSAWTMALRTDAQYIMHWESDFVALDKIPIRKMVRVLQENPRVAQVSLKRQAVNEVEAAVGGYMQCAPEQYTEHGDYVSHRTIFTFNPSIIPRAVAELCLADPGDGLERGFTDTLLDRGYSFGIYGTINDAPRVNHIGEHRSQGWRV
jgi:hypothetical protein